MPSVIDEIARLRRPGDVANWWGHCVLNDWTHALEEEETNYMDVFTSADVEPVLRIGRGIATVENLDQHELQLARERYGEGRIALERFVNRENRRRIIAHYVWTHPATVQYELQLYRLTRDVNPVTFVADRIHQLFTGKELFIGDQVSRIGAAVDLLIPIVLTRILRAVRPAVGTSRPARPLTDPIYDLPPEGGGMMINGRWYTEHALERMAPDTVQVRAEIARRMADRLRRLGISEGSEAWNACLQKVLGKVDPRGVPPSVVEAEITRPGSTNIRVITANRKQVVVTVIFRKPKP